MLISFSNHEPEAAIVGKIVAGYGELEFVFGGCLNHLVQQPDQDAGFRMFYRTRGEEQRIQIADALLRPHFDAHHLTGPYTEALADTHWCRQVRNQYAHCHWVQFNGALAFLHFEEIAKTNRPLMFDKKVVTTELLEAQLEYFHYVDECLSHCLDQAESWFKNPSVEIRPLPKKIARPEKFVLANQSSPELGSAS